jgi:hypothetical protein
MLARFGNGLSATYLGIIEEPSSTSDKLTSTTIVFSQWRFGAYC